MSVPYPQKHLLCLGWGYSAQVLSSLLDPQEWKITGTCRSSSGSTPPPVELLPFEAGKEFSPSLLAAFKTTTHLLSSIPPTSQGDPVIPALKRIRDTFCHLQWVGYFSTTGVYGNHGGEWVTEATPPHPTSPRSQWRLQAEEDWRQSSLPAPLHIFRLSGIYGPHRHVFPDLLSQKTRRIDLPDHVFSRIHVTDIGRLVKASLENPGSGAYFNLADDYPTCRNRLLEWACHLAHIPYPPLLPLAQAGLSPMAQDFYKDSKRVSNSYTKKNLKISLKYPTFYQGLTSLWLSFQKKI